VVSRHAGSLPAAPGEAASRWSAATGYARCRRRYAVSVATFAAASIFARRFRHDSRRPVARPALQRRRHTPDVQVVKTPISFVDGSATRCASSATPAATL